MYATIPVQNSSLVCMALVWLISLKNEIPRLLWLWDIQNICAEHFLLFSFWRHWKSEIRLCIRSIDCFERYVLWALVSTLQSKIWIKCWSARGLGTILGICLPTGNPLTSAALAHQPWIWNAHRRSACVCILFGLKLKCSAHTARAS